MRAVEIQDCPLCRIQPEPTSTNGSSILSTTWPQHFNEGPEEISVGTLAATATTGFDRSRSWTLRDKSLVGCQWKWERYRIQTRDTSFWWPTCTTVSGKVWDGENVSTDRGCSHCRGCRGEEGGCLPELCENRCVRWQESLTSARTWFCLWFSRVTS